MTQNEVNKQIHFVLEPVLGQLMTEATIMTQCKRIGINPEFISFKDLPAFSKAVQKALTIFLGSYKAQKIAQTIEHIVDNY